MFALSKNATWSLVTRHSGKTTVGCHWLYIVMYLPDGSIEHLKACLVAKGYTLTYGTNYAKTSPIAKISYVRILISLVANLGWPLFQLDIKNAFLKGDLKDEVYMELPPGFGAWGSLENLCQLHKAIYGLKQFSKAWFGKFSEAMLKFGLQRCHPVHSVFSHTFARGKILLIVYVDDIIINRDDKKVLMIWRDTFQTSFQTKDLGKLHYFLGIEVARSKEGISLSQRKYVLDILEETNLLWSKPVETPMDPNVKLYEDQGDLLSNTKRYRCLVSKLNYLTITFPDISFAVSVLS